MKIHVFYLIPGENPTPFFPKFHSKIHGLSYLFPEIFQKMVNCQGLSGLVGERLGSEVLHKLLRAPQQKSWENIGKPMKTWGTSDENHWKAKKCM